jgi:cytochrome c oxidase subunit 2
MTVLVDSLINPASDQADQIYRLSVYFIIAASAVFLLVVVLLIHILIKYRSKPSDSEPKQTKDNKAVERWMVAGPAILVALFFYLTIDTMHRVQPPITDQKPDIVITGHQFWWEVNYPDDSVTTANEVHMPVGKKLLVQLNSADVIHDWWVPSLGNKMDLIPGRDNHVWITIHNPGIYEGTCSEFCGAQHAWMRIKVIAQSPEDFQAWLVKDKSLAPEITGESALKGKNLFLQSSCSSCHSIRGTTAQGKVGPDLTHIASRSTLLAGMLSNNESNLGKWIGDPQKIKPGSMMPKFIYQQDSIKSLVSFISQLK